MINLLPRKEFEIKLSDGQIISGKFGTWAMKMFCIKKGVDIQEFGQFFAIRSDKNPEGLTVIEVVDNFALFLLCAVEYSVRKSGKAFNYNEINAYDWIDEMGGTESEDFTKLVNLMSDEEAKESDEKKSSLIGENSNATITVPV